MDIIGHKSYYIVLHYIHCITSYYIAYRGCQNTGSIKMHSKTAEGEVITLARALKSEQKFREWVLSDTNCKKKLNVEKRRKKAQGPGL